jgi:hypothetical protein
MDFHGPQVHPQIASMNAQDVAKSEVKKICIFLTSD